MKIPTVRRLDEIAVGYVGKPAAREVVPPDPAYSTRWHTHDYPDPLARWNFHPEFEIHLITSSSGLYIVGDEIGSFSAGQLFLVGPEVPHDWISDLQSGQVIHDRDVVLQFRIEWLQECARVLPELQEIERFLSRATGAMEILGATRDQAARELMLIGSTEGAARILHTFGLLHELASAPPEEVRYLMNGRVVRVDDPEASEVLARAIDFIFANISAPIRLSQAAAIAGMSDSAFSRFFKAASGLSFSEMVRNLRLTEASRFLENSRTPIATIATDVGFSNLSNFNRQFRERFKTTPSEYRTRSRVTLGSAHSISPTPPAGPPF